MSFSYENNLTYKAEGNNNSKSKWYSRKLHHPSFKSGVTIGRGYDLKKRSPNQIRKELSEAGFPQEKIEILVKASQLSENQAEEFVKNNKNFEISLEEQQNLFHTTYMSYETEIKKFFQAKDWEKISQNHKELLVDLLYRGDFNQNTRKFLMSAIQIMLETNDSTNFEKIFSDQNLWKN